MYCINFINNALEKKARRIKQLTDDAIHKINWLIKNPEKMMEIARNGRKKTLEIFSYKNSCRKIVNLINESLC